MHGEACARDNMQQLEALARRQSSGMKGILPAAGSLGCHYEISCLERTVQLLQDTIAAGGQLSVGPGSIIACCLLKA